jgi:hypothetical protein
MTKKELKLVEKVLEKIMNPDSYVIEALHNVKKDILRYDRMKNQLKEMSAYEYPWYGE